MKKVLSIILSLVMVLVALPMTVIESSAVTYVKSQDELWMYYLDSNNNVIIEAGGSNKAYLGTDTDVTIPSTIDGNTVICVGAYAFYNCNTIESVTIPEGVSNFGNHAFDGCTALESINFPSTMYSINQYAFNNCTSLTSVDLGTSLQIIGQYAFYGCSNLASIYIPASLTSIGGYAFNGCNNVATYVKDLSAWCAINFNNGGGYYSNPMERAHILYVYDSTESDYVLAENIVIPAGVTSISAGAFDGCQTVKSVVLPEGLTTINQYAFRSCSNLESITLPSTLTSISSNNVFQSCNKLNAVSITDLEAWCNLTFTTSTANPLYYAKNLYLNDSLITNLVIPNTVTEVKRNSFNYATCFTSVTIPDSVTAIGDEAFYGCSELQSITIGDSLATVGSNAFYNCSKLNAVYITDLEAWCNIQFSNQTSNPLYYGHNLYVNNVCSDITIPSTVTTIKQYAFTGIGNNVTIPGNVTQIGSYAFANGTLSTAVIQEGVQTIKSYAFNGCTSMTSVYIPSTLTVTENYAFGSCNKLNTYITDLEAWCKVQFGDSGGYYANPMETGHNLYLNGNLVTDLVIPNTLTEIKYCSFMGGSCIKTVTIPEGVTTIGRLAFYYCTNLESITIPTTLTTINSDRVFQGCNSLKEVHISDLEAWCNIPFPNNTSNPLSYAKNLYLGDNKITDLVIPSTVTTVKSYTFYNGSGFTSLTIPDTVTSISSDSFNGCSGLQSITIGDSLTSIGNNAFNSCSNLNAVYITDLAAWCNITFSNQTSNPLYYGHNLYVNNVLGEINIPTAVTAIKPYAFTGLKNDVIIPGNVTEIGTYAFANATLEFAELQDGVQIIRSHAFENNSSLKIIYLPASLLTSEVYAFNGCTKVSTYIDDLEAWCNITFGNGTGYYANPLESGHNLYLNEELVTDLVIPDTVTELKYCSFMGCTMKSVRLPKGLTTIGNLSFYNCANLKSIVIPDTVDTIGSDRVFAYCNALTNYYCFKGTRGDTYWTNTSSKYYMGDTNVDGEIDIDDIGFILSASAGLIDVPNSGNGTVTNIYNTGSISASVVMNEVQQIVADYNLDGAIDGFDVAAVDRYVYA